MSIKDQLIKDNAIFLDTDAFAELVTYNGISIAAVIEVEDSAIHGDTFEKVGTSAVGTIQVSTADVPTPNTGDVVVCHSGTWTVVRILESDFAMHKLQIISEESPWP